MLSSGEALAAGSYPVSTSSSQLMTGGCLEDAAEELRRMEEAEAARREQEKLAVKAKDAQKLFKAV